MTGSLTKQILQEHTYIFDTFKFECTYRYFLENYHSVEIMLPDGTICTERFIAPVYCRFLPANVREEILSLHQLYTDKVEPERTLLRLKTLLRNVAYYKKAMKYEQTV
jgi:hypothetical protein